MLRLLSLTIISLLTFLDNCVCQEIQIDPKFYMTDGPVNSIELDENNNSLYIGGQFGVVGPYAPNGNVISPTNDTLYYNSDNPNESVLASVGDNNGGWFIGGGFTMVGETPRNYIAHIDSLGKVDSTFFNNGLNGKVTDLKIKDSLLYIVGEFNQYGNFRKGNVFYNETTKQIDQIKHNFNAEIFDIIEDGNGGWFISGNFKTLFGKPRKGIAHFNSNDSLSDWNIEANSHIYKMILIGDSLFIAGDFSEINNVAISYLAIVNKSTGDLLNWSAPDLNGVINNIEYIGNNTILYQGGEVGFGGIHLATGELSPNWNLDHFASIKTICFDGNKVFLGGSFSSIYGVSRANIACFTTNGALLPWNTGTSGVVHKIAVYNDRLFIAGNFSQIMNSPRLGFGEVSASTGALASLNLNYSLGNIKSMLVYDNSLYIASSKYEDYSNYMPVSILKEFDLITNTVTDWDSKSTITAFFTSQEFVLKKINDQIFFSNKNLSIGSSIQKSIIKYNINTAEYQPMDISFNNYISKIAIKDSIIILAGDFTTMNNQPQFQLAALNLNNMSTMNWTPFSSGSNIIKCMEIDDTILFVGGLFNSIQSQPRINFAGIDLTNFSLLPWSIEPNNEILSLKANANKIVIGGYFTTVNNQSHNSVAIINKTNGVLSPWVIPINNGYVQDIFLTDSILILIGSISDSFSGIVSFNINTQTIRNWQPKMIMGNCFTISKSANNYYIGGKYSSINGIPRNNLAALDLTTGIPKPLSFKFDLDIEKVHISGDTLFARGVFSHVNNIPRNSIVGIDITNNSITDFNPTNDLSSNIKTLATFQNNLLVPHNNNVAVLNRATGDIIEEYPSTYFTSELINYSNQLLVSGHLNNVGGTNVNNFYSLMGNPPTIAPFINANGFVRDMSLQNDTLYLVGDFNSINGVNRNYLAAYDLINSSVTNLNIPLLYAPSKIHALPNSFILINDSWKPFELLKANGNKTNWVSEASQSYALNGNATNFFVGGLNLTSWGRFGLFSYKYCTPPDIPVIIASTDTICIGQSVQLTIQSGNLNEANQWVWYENEVGHSAIGYGNSINVNPSETKQYYVRGEGGCAYKNYAQNIKVIVDEIPPIITDCPNNIEITNNNVNCSAIVNWIEPSAYDNCSTPVVSQNYYSGSLFPQGITEVIYTYHDNAANYSYCKFNVDITSDINFTYESEDVDCNGGRNGEINVIVDGGSFPYDYNWNNNEFTTANISNLNAGLYHLVVTDSAGCIATDTIAISEPPNINTILSINSSSITVNEEVQFDSYNWVNCENDFSTIGYPSINEFIAPYNGIYAVIVTSGSCIDTSDCIQFNSVNLELLSELPNVYFFPNPTDHKTVLMGEELDTYQVAVYNIYGITQELEFTNNSIDFSNLVPGTYFIQLVGTEKKYTFSIIRI